MEFFQILLRLQRLSQFSKVEIIDVLPIIDPFLCCRTFLKFMRNLFVRGLINFWLINNYYVTISLVFDQNYQLDLLALLQLVDELSKSIDEGNITVGVFVDLAKAFDTVDHKIMLAKLQYYGIRGVSNKWFSSYLSNRKQYVSINNSKSLLYDISCGVPQGSILGPILFIIYINDLNSVSQQLRNIMFADDTNLFLTGNSIETIESLMNRELCNLIEWFQANLLSFNISKTNYIVFSKKKKYYC